MNELIITLHVNNALQSNSMNNINREKGGIYNLQDNEKTN